MTSSLFFKPTLFSAALALGILQGCGGGGSGANKDEIPYVLPAGTTITVNLARPASGTTQRGTDAPIPMPQDELDALDWGTRTFTLSVHTDGIASWQIFGMQTGSQFAYKRLSATSFSLAISWFGGAFNLRQCTLAKVSDIYGTVGSWDYSETRNNITTTLIGGGTPGDRLQYTTNENSTNGGTESN